MVYMYRSLEWYLGVYECCGGWRASDREGGCSGEVGYRYEGVYTILLYTVYTVICTLFTFVVCILLCVM